MPRLLVLSGPARGQELEFEFHEPVAVGRRPGSRSAKHQFALADPTLARCHFMIFMRPGGLAIVETFSVRPGLDVEPVLLDGESTGGRFLTDGSVIMVGRSRIEFDRLRDDAGRPLEPPPRLLLLFRRRLVEDQEPLSRLEEDGLLSDRERSRIDDLLLAVEREPGGMTTHTLATAVFAEAKANARLAPMLDGLLRRMREFVGRELQRHSLSPSEIDEAASTILPEIWETILGKRGRYHYGRSIRAYVSGVCRKKAIDQVEKRRKRITVPLEEGRLADPSSGASELSACAEEIYSEVIDQSPRAAHMLALAAHGANQIEIAHELGIDRSTVRRELNSVRQSMFRRFIGRVESSIAGGNWYRALDYTGFALSVCDSKQEPDVRRLRAGCFRRAGDLEQALAELDRVAPIGEGVDHYYERAQVLRALGRHREAYRDLKRILAATEERKQQLAFLMVDCLLSLGQAEQAERILAAASLESLPEQGLPASTADAFGAATWAQARNEAERRIDRAMASRSDPQAAVAS